MLDLFLKSKEALKNKGCNIDFLNSIPQPKDEFKPIYDLLFSGEPLGKDELLSYDKSVLQCLYLVKAAELTQNCTYMSNGKNLDYYADIIRFIGENHNRFCEYDITGNFLYHVYRYLRGIIVHLGRLCFEIKHYDFFYDVTNGDETVLDGSSWVLSVHIPGNEPILPEKIDESFKLADEFFAKYHPDKDFKAFVCASWLLDTQLNKFFGENSNVVAFQNRFTIKRGNEIPECVCDHIFGCPQMDFKNLEPKNRFQREVKEFLLNGGKLYSGKGYILR